MKFAELGNIWTSDLGGLSNTDKGRVYFERAKLVVADALADKNERVRAVKGRRFARHYLVKKIGCQPAVAQQNPKIRKLLVDTDAKLSREVSAASSKGIMRSRQLSDEADLRETVASLRQRIETVERENHELRRQLRMAGNSG